MLAGSTRMAVLASLNPNRSHSHRKSRPPARSPLVQSDIRIHPRQQNHRIGPFRPPQRATQPANPHSPLHRCSPTNRDFVPWRFSDAGRISVWRGRHRRRLKTCTKAVFPAPRQLGSFTPISRPCGRQPGGRTRATDRDRGEPRDSAPPTPPYVRVRIRRFEKSC
jgi:hypothetical protein